MAAVKICDLCRKTIEYDEVDYRVKVKVERKRIFSLQPWAHIYEEVDVCGACMSEISNRCNEKMNNQK